jgi:hypothetical protein
MPRQRNPDLLWITSKKRGDSKQRADNGPNKNTPVSAISAKQSASRFPEMRIGNGLPMESVAFGRFQGQFTLASPLRKFPFKTARKAQAIEAVAAA